MGRCEEGKGADDSDLLTREVSDQGAIEQKCNGKILEN
jgi:hypothetical protein